MTSTGHFLPDEKNHEATRLLPYVMAVMVYLSALAAMGGLMINSGFGQWTESLNNRLTIQITTADHNKREAQVGDVSRILQQTPGIDSVRRLNDDEIAELLEPWLGAGNVTDDLPVPAILDVRLNASLKVDLDALRGMLAQISDQGSQKGSGDIYLDDHQQWLGRFIRLMDTVKYTALGILVLVVLATICIVIFGTKASMAENRDIIEIMHHLGAQDGMIARAYQDRFMKYGLKGGIMGLILAFITLGALIYLSRDLASDLVDRPDVPLSEIGLLFVVPVCAAFISMLTARITVMRHLSRMV